MENATKALEMAGSVLIGVLLLGCLLFAYTRMSELKDTEHKVEVSRRKILIKIMKPTIEIIYMEVIYFLWQIK